MLLRLPFGQVMGLLLSATLAVIICGQAGFAPLQGLDLGPCSPCRVGEGTVVFTGRTES